MTEKSNIVWVVGILLLVGFVVTTSDPSRESFMDKFQFRLTEADIGRNFMVGDANFKMISNPVYTCDTLPNNDWVSYSSSDKECWEQEIEFFNKQYMIPAEEKFNLNDYLVVTWKPGFMMDITQDGNMDKVRINSIFIFEFTDYSFLDIKLVRDQYGVVNGRLPVELTINNNMFGLEGKLIYNSDKKMNLRFNIGTTVHTLYYPVDKIGEQVSEYKFILLVPSYEGEREITLPLQIEDTYTVLDSQPEQNPKITVQ